MSDLKMGECGMKKGSKVKKRQWIIVIRRSVLNECLIDKEIIPILQITFQEKMKS